MTCVWFHVQRVLQELVGAQRTYYRLVKELQDEATKNELLTR